MTLWALLMLQAALPPADFDLRTVDPQPGCATAKGDEIVVCGTRREDKYRLQPLPPGNYEVGPPMARLGILGDGSASVVGETNAMPGGAVSNLVMLRLTKPF